ncbi:carboxypeptidase-like regulatory domain-containing protein [Sungkyunkwania multivorans]|uniref:Carboxypeptidase-like regulatory domain-containing protein n=1 Tax=Sungkyunkwania multivorans TaxID=1173618 RepID=A0ABW3CXN3_9FLAO
MKKLLPIILLFLVTVSYAQKDKDGQLPLEVIGQVVNSVDDSPMESVHVINLNTVVGTVTDSKGNFTIKASVDDELYFSFLGFKAIKVKVTRDLLRFEGTIIKLTEFAYALENVEITPYNLTGYLEIDARNVPINTSRQYSISGLPTGYEGGNRSPGAFTKAIGAIFNPASLLHNIFGKKPQQMRKLRKMKKDDEIRNLLASKFDRETLVQLIQVERIDIDEILRNCNYSDSFIRSANDLQILDAISDCYEEYRVLNRG